MLIWDKICKQQTGLKSKDRVGTTGIGGFFTPNSALASWSCCSATRLGDVDELYEHSSGLPLGTNIGHTENWCLMSDGRRHYLVIDAGIITDEQGEMVAVEETQLGASN